MRFRLAFGCFSAVCRLILIYSDAQAVDPDHMTDDPSRGSPEIERVASYLLWGIYVSQNPSISHCFGSIW